MNDDQKITWKNGSSNSDLKNNTSSIPAEESKKSPILGDDILHDLAQRSAEHKSNNNVSGVIKKEETISDLQADIKKLMDGLEDGENKIKPDQGESSSKIESSKESAAISAALGAIGEKKMPMSENANDLTSEVSLENEESKVDSIKESILNDLGVTDDKESIIDDQTKKLLDQKEQTKGIDKTYYSDLSTAMGSNKPATMAELLEKSRFEKAEGAVFSPKSKKNILYIIGTLLLLGGIIFVVSMFTGKDNESVEYITKERVKSLVYSDMDTGINTTNIDSEQTKQAIRQVVEKELDKDTIQQIYYVKEDDFGNLRRTGIKQVFESTGNLPPEFLYQNIENDFMHGVYKDDKNYPFIILNAISYDRAFEGMKQWEPTMIDDLSTYLDLPDEAGDRSLMEDGFSDNIIQNKTARVVRFLPREVDQRKGFLDSVTSFFGGNKDEKKENKETPDTIIEDVENSQINTLIEEETVVENVVAYLIKYAKNHISNIAYAENIKRCYKVEYQCMDFEGNISTCAANVLNCRYKKEGCDIGGVKDFVIMPEILNKNSDTSYAYSSTFDADYNYSCIETVNGSEIIEDNILNLDGLKCANDKGEDVSYNETDFKNGLQTCNIVCYGSEKKCFDAYGKDIPAGSSDPSKTCYNVIQNQTGDIPYGPDKYNQDGYMCVSSILGATTIHAEEMIDQIKLEGDDVICYEKERYCVDEDGKKADYNSSDPKQICHDIVKNKNSDPYKTLDDLEGLSQDAIRENYSCIRTINGSNLINQSTQDGENLICYESFKECFDADGVPTLFISGDTTITCNTIIKNTKSDLTYGPEYQGQVDSHGNPFVCVGSTGDVNAIGDDMGYGYGLADSVVCYPSHWECTDEYGNYAFYNPNDSRLLCNKIINNMALPVYGGVSESEMDNYICSGYNDSSTLVDSRNPLAWIQDLFPDGLVLPGGPIAPGDTVADSITITGNSNISVGNMISGIDGNILDGNSVVEEGTTLNLVELIQGVFVSLGIMETISTTGEYDSYTQEIITGFQAINGLDETGLIDQNTINVLNNVISGAGEIYGGSQAALINDYITTGEQIGIGTYNEDVQAIQILLFSEGYEISHLNGVFDRELCDAVRAYEEDSAYVLSSEDTCILSASIIDSFNNLIKDKGYLGSGYILNGNNYLIGSGILKGKDGPGTVGFTINKAEADTLDEGEVVLIYTFLDEKTILITRDEVVIPEIIKRRAFDDIFNKDK